MSPRTFHRPDNSPPFLHAAGYFTPLPPPPPHHHHHNAPIYIKRYTVRVYKINSGQGQGIWVSVSLLKILRPTGQLGSGLASSVGQGQGQGQYLTSWVGYGQECGLVPVFSCSIALGYADWPMVVVEGGKCPTPCKKGGELSGRAKLPGGICPRGNVAHSIRSAPRVYYSFSVPLRIGNSAGLITQQVSNLFKVACSGPSETSQLDTTATQLHANRIHASLSYSALGLSYCLQVERRCASVSSFDKFELMMQEAQLSQRDRAMLRVIEYFAKSLAVIQGHSK